MTKLDARWDIGLVKIASDLVNKNNNKVFITLNNEGLPDEFSWFNENDKGEVVDKGRLENSYPDKTFFQMGTYEKIMANAVKACFSLQVQIRCNLKL